MKEKSPDVTKEHENLQFNHKVELQRLRNEASRTNHQFRMEEYSKEIELIEKELEVVRLMGKFHITKK